MTETEATYRLPASAVQRLLDAHDGDVSLLYLHVLRAGAFDAEAAAAALCRTAREIDAAAEKLRRMGLMDAPTAEADRLLPPADALPSYTAQELVRLSESDPGLQTVYREGARVFARKLSPADMNMLAGIYQHLGMPAEVILVLLNYCAEAAAARRPGAVPSPHGVEKTAYDWAKREILTLEQAEDYLRYCRTRREQTQRVLEELHLRESELTKSGRDYIEAWLSMGFGPEAIAVAYDRTVINTGSLRWRYMDKILQSWHSRDLHTPEEIEAGDGRRPARAETAPSTPVNMDELIDIFDKI